MSRRISIQGELKSEILLEDTLQDLGVGYHRPAVNVFRVRSSASGHSLLYGGLTLTKHQGSDTFTAFYDEDCSLSRETLGLITQGYLHRHYIEAAQIQGDQILSEFIATGYEQDPLVQAGDVVIVAQKG